MSENEHDWQGNGWCAFNSREPSGKRARNTRVGPGARRGVPFFGESMELCHSWSKRPIKLSATRRYTPEEVREKCKRASAPYWLRVEGKLIQVHGEACLQLACQVSAAYHDWLAFNAAEDDGFGKDMAAREERVRQHMEEAPSEDSEYDGEDEW